MGITKEEIKRIMDIVKATKCESICGWKYIKDDQFDGWITGCSNLFGKNESIPLRYGMIYCPYCERHIEVIK